MIGGALRTSQVFTMVLLLGWTTFSSGVAWAHECQNVKTQVTLPLLKVTPTSFSFPASQDCQQPMPPTAINAPKLRSDSSGPSILIRTRPQATVRSCSGLMTLLDAPRSQAVSPSRKSDSQQSGTASLSGTIVDKKGDLLEGAQVTLTGPPGSPVRTVQSGSNGQFEFTGLAPDIYKLTVNAPRMNTFTSSDIPLHAGAFYTFPPVTLSFSPVFTTVTVSGNSKHLSEEQVHIAEQQRIAGIIPNFYSSYNRNAPPLLAKQKFQLSIRSIIDPVSFLSVAGVAGAEQYENVFPAYGGGIEGYGKRYGAALANHVSGDLLGRAVYPSIFHQDPRYFYKGNGSIESRALYAISAAVIAKGDNGRWEPNYSLVLGHFSAAAISNLYYPSSDRGASLVVLNGLAGIGGDAVSYLIREFILKRFTSRVPKGANSER